MSLVRKTFELEGNLYECCAVVTSDNQIYCKLKELAVFLGYSGGGNLPHLEKKWKFSWAQLKNWMIHSTNVYFHDNTLFVSEHGIYNLLFRSRKLKAKQFTDYIIEVVLPALRQTGERPAALVATLRETLLEKERELIETREKLTQLEWILAEKDKLLEETRRALEEVNRLLVQTREEKDSAVNEILTETRRTVMEKDRALERMVKQQNVPRRKSVRHCLCIFQNGRVYKIIRTQKCNLPRSIKRISPEFKMVYKALDLQNSFYIVNRLREILPKGSCKYNTIVSDVDVVALVERCKNGEI